MDEDGACEFESGRWNAQDTANHIFIDLEAKKLRQLLSNSGTAPIAITPLHLDNRVDEFFAWPLWPRSASWREQRTKVRFLSAMWKSSRVAGLRTMAARRGRDGRKRVHRAAMIRSAGHRLGARLARVSRSATDGGPPRIRPPKHQNTRLKPIFVIRH